jgi:hypothetical protein
MIPTGNINPEVGGGGFPQIKLPPITPVIEPKGPLLKLAATLNYILLDMPNELSPETVNGIFVGKSQKPFTPYALVDVLAVGPDVKSVKKSDRVLVMRPQCDQCVFDGNSYWRTTEAAIIGIVEQP